MEVFPTETQPCGEHLNWTKTIVEPVSEVSSSR